MKNKECAPMRRLKNALTFGNLWVYILSLIRREKRTYAYELPEKMGEKFLFRPNRVMIYVVLYKLEAEGLIRSEFEERRKYYHLTEKGKVALKGAKEYLLLLSKRL